MAYNPLAYNDPASPAHNYLAQQQQDALMQRQQQQFSAAQAQQQFANNLATRDQGLQEQQFTAQQAQQVAAQKAAHEKEGAQWFASAYPRLKQDPSLIPQALAFAKQKGYLPPEVPDDLDMRHVDAIAMKLGIAPLDPKVEPGFSLSPGEVRFDSTGKRIASVAPRPAAPAGGAGGLAPDASTNAADVAKQIANYQIPPLGAFALRTPWGQQVMAEVGRINPEYNANEFSARKSAFNQFASGKLGNHVRSFNVALSHLDTLSQAATALGNGDVQGFNRVSQFFAQQTGSEAPTNFDAMKKVVGDELVKSIVGSGGGVADREEVAHTLSRVSSPSQLAGVISSYQKLMGGQLGGLRRQYEHSTGRKDFESLLSPEAIPYLQTHEAQGTSGPKPPQAGETAAQRAARLGIK